MQSVTWCTRKLVPRLRHTFGSDGSGAGGYFGIRSHFFSLPLFFPLEFGCTLLLFTLTVILVAAATVVVVAALPKVDVNGSEEALKEQQPLRAVTSDVLVTTSLLSEESSPKRTSLAYVYSLGSLAFFWS